MSFSLIILYLNQLILKLDENQKMIISEHNDLILLTIHIFYIMVPFYVLMNLNH